MIAIRTSLIKIGNSTGLRIPRTILRQLKLTGEVELEVKQDYLIVRSAENPRANWDEAFRCAGEGSDESLDEWSVVGLAEDRSEWTW
ncbi:MAG TPA: AbrB/MazE/SpoVT family DNA-binding domain-containing protein [Candidatus Riflebacteria bacterium]|jgi:antitoxin MazE|nr:AbrB/MazE/SpoVT family DNA-binding domain-containing protein [Candidatus Riflebacteria bacterium]